MLAKKYCIGLLAVLVLCGLTLPGLFPSGPSKTSMLANDGWIEGQVTDGTDPLPNAYVLYFMSSGGGGGGPLGTNLTDATGHYNLTVIGGIGYTVIAVHGDHYAASGSDPALGMNEKGTPYTSAYSASNMPLLFGA